MGCSSLFNVNHDWWPSGVVGQNHCLNEYFRSIRNMVKFCRNFECSRADVSRYGLGTETAALIHTVLKFTDQYFCQLICALTMNPMPSGVVFQAVESSHCYERNSCSVGYFPKRSGGSPLNQGECVHKCLTTAMDELLDSGDCALKIVKQKLGFERCHQTRTNPQVFVCAHGSKGIRTNITSDRAYFPCRICGIGQAESLLFLVEESTATITRIMTPDATFCQKDGTFSKLNPFASKAKNTAPAAVRHIEPSPPARLVPPTSTAAMTESSSP